MIPLRARRLALWMGAGLGLLAVPSAATPAPAELGQAEISLKDPCAPEADGRYRLPVCSELCVQRVWQWRFWVTNYNVAGTWGYGEHQGIGIFGFGYSYDARFGPGEGKVPPPWSRAGENPARQRLLRPEARSPAAIVLEAALCELPSTMHERFIYNHGRTLALGESGSKWDSSGLFMDVPGRGTITRGPVRDREWSDSAAPIRRLVETTQTCVERIEDGFCDSVCGNCSYVLPPKGGSGDLITSIEGQRTQFELTEGHVDRRVRYVLTTLDADDPAQTVTVNGAQGFLDGHTHCVVDGGEEPSQALATRLAWAGGEDRFVTGRWGHNSNTDAAAELDAFEQCGESRPDDLEFFHLACHGCGEREGRWDRPGGETQWPCLDRRNTAMSTWSETVDRHNVNDSTLGVAPGKFPRCRSEGHPVHGM